MENSGDAGRGRGSRAVKKGVPSAPSPSQHPVHLLIWEAMSENQHQHHPKHGLIGPQRIMGKNWMAWCPTVPPFWPLTLAGGPSAGVVAAAGTLGNALCRR